MKGQELTKDGLHITLVQQAYISDNGTQYQANAYDKYCNEYIVTWDVVNHETDDESEACDWKEFEIKLIDTFEALLKRIRIMN